MKIGIDIDGVLIDFEERFRCKAELFHYIERKNPKPKDNDFYWVQDNYEWSEEDWNIFQEKYLLRLTEESNILPGVKEVLELLKQENNELIIISARGTEFDEMITLVEKKIKDNNLKFDKYYWKTQDKLKICKDEQIDIMIDDNPNTCQKLSQNNIKTLYFRSIYGKRMQENENLKEVHNWGQVYTAIKNGLDF